MKGLRPLKAFVTALWLCAPGARAVEVGPEALAFRALPGKRATDRLTVRNDAFTPLRARVTVETDGGDGWLAVSPRNLWLAPGGMKTVRVIARPGRDDRGERTARVVVTVPGPEDSEIRVVRRATLIVEGTERPSAVVDHVAARRDHAGARLEARVRNDGNIGLRVKAVTELYLTNGRRTRSAPTDVTALSPGDIRLMSMSVPGAESDWGGRGRVMVYFLDTGGRTLAREREFGPEVLTR